MSDARTPSGKKGAKRLMHIIELRLSREKHSSMAFSWRDVAHSENDATELSLADTVRFSAFFFGGELTNKYTAYE